ncbi:MAG: ATP-binding protein [Verrucomicrobiota bacterium]
MKSTTEILDNTEIVPKTCRECGESFILAFPSLAPFVDVCPNCSEHHAIVDARQALAEAERARNDRWERLCPLEFRDTKLERLPVPNATKRVLAWQYGPRGLILHGPTGTGKSRSSWLLLRREFKAGRRIVVMDYSAGIEYARQYSESTRTADNWVCARMECDLLFMDDVLKARLSDGFEAALFAIVAERTENGRPIIATTNDTGTSLEARMTDDRGAALVRRLREHCDSVTFTKGR